MFVRFSTMALCALIGTAASAVPITISPYGNRADINAALDGYASSSTTQVREDFEQFGTVAGNATVAFESGTRVSPGVVFGELTAAGIATQVGTITTYGNLIGSGGTCRGLDLNNDNCSNIALQSRTDLHGQGNIAPEGGSWSLNAADTGGFIWTAASPLINDISKMVFALRDAADAGASVSVSTEVNGVVYNQSVSRLGNENLQLIEIDFGGLGVSSAEITIASSRRNDSMTIDGMMLIGTFNNGSNETPPAPIPLPSTGLMLIGALGAFGVGRKLLNKRAKA